MSHITIAPAAAPTTASLQQKPSAQATFETRLKAALEHARRLTAMHGPKSIDAAIAWETVEELQTAQSRGQRTTPTTAFARYCIEHPHARESRVYDV